MMMSLYSNLLDAVQDAANADAAMRQIDACRRLVIGPGMSSVQMNVTTAADPKNEVRLQRFYSSMETRWPVAGRKRKTHTRWTDTLFVRGEVCINEGIPALREAYDDYEQMRPLGIQASINVPVMKGALCYATFNVFGCAPAWEPEQVFAVRLMALAAARWLTPPPELAYSFESSSPAALVPATLLD